MLEKSRLGRQFWNVMKIFVVALAVYLALTFKIVLVGETDEVNKFDYLQTEENLNQNTVEDQEHWSSSAFFNLCTKYIEICKKLSWVGEFSDEEKSEKFVYVVYLLQTLDKNIRLWANPSEALLAMLINEKKWSRRGSANRNTITMNLGWMQYDNEFFQVLSHEMGHIVDLWWLQWISSKKSSIFTEFGKSVFAIDDPSLEYYKYSRSSEKIRKSWMIKEDFCSGYGMSDPFEDFAECHNLYLNHHDYFRKIALLNQTMKNKYNFFSNLYGWEYINNSEVKYEDRDDTHRARDTTKMREW